MDGQRQVAARPAGRADPRRLRAVGPRYARRGKEPLVDLRLFGRASYRFGITLITHLFRRDSPRCSSSSRSTCRSGCSTPRLQAGLAITPFALGSAARRRPRRPDRATGTAGPLVARRAAPRRRSASVGTVVAVHLVPDHGTGWATLLPLTVAGIGGGLVIAPNQALTLSEVPVERAGTAGGLLQTGQRIGAAIGIAAVGSAFFSRLAVDPRRLRRRVRARGRDHARLHRRIAARRGRGHRVRPPQPGRSTRGR